MRKFFQRFSPSPETLRSNRLLAMLGERLHTPSLWHMNRRSVAGGVAVGLFCGLIPGPLQMLGAAVACIVWRVNLPVALAATFYTNPLTIVPLYVVAFGIGRFLTGDDSSFVPPPEWGDQSLWSWCGHLVDWLLGLGAPLAVGLPTLALLLAVSGYFIVDLLWRLHIRRAWRRRGGESGDR